MLQISVVLKALCQGESWKALNDSFVHKIQGVVELERVVYFQVEADDKQGEETGEGSMNKPCIVDDSTK